MRRRALGLATGLLVVAACGAGGPGAISPGVPACPTPAIDDRLEPEPSPTLCPSGSGNGQGGQGGAGGNAATPTSGPGGGGGGAPGGAGGAGGAAGGAGGGNTITRVWTEAAEVSDGSTYSLIEQSYRAVVQVNLSGGDGSWAFTGSAQSRPGEAPHFVELRAEMRVLVVLANTPHVLDPRPEYRAGHVRIHGWHGDVTAPDDEIRTSTPERLRAFESVEDLYA